MIKYLILLEKKGRRTKSPAPFLYIPMHEVAPSAVSTAVITDAMICSVHFSVSFLVIIYLLSAFRFCL